MLGTLISEVRKAELADPPQPLKLLRVDQIGDQMTIIRASIDANNVMYRVAVYPFRHFLNYDTSGDFGDRAKKRGRSEERPPKRIVCLRFRTGSGIRIEHNALPDMRSAGRKFDYGSESHQGH